MTNFKHYDDNNDLFTDKVITDEDIIIESEDVTWCSNSTVEEFDYFFLTRDGLHLEYMENSERTILSRSLFDIEILDEEPLVKLVLKREYGLCLEIQFKQGKEYFIFAHDSRRTVDRWVKAIAEEVLDFKGLFEETDNETVRPPIPDNNK